MPVSNSNSALRLPAALIILDGYGLDAPGPGNATRLARSPHLAEISLLCPHTQLAASGEAVGLPEGQMGNSEVGHLNIGAGRIVFQELTRINRACADGSIEENPVLMEAFDAVSRTPGAALHFMGLLSDGGVHSNNEHLYALLRMAVARKVPQVYVHCFMDGRDVPPKSGAGYVTQLAQKLAEYATPGTRMEIASIEGRYYAMDRDNRWERVERAYRSIVQAQPFAEGVAPVQVMNASYEDGVTDEFVEPVALVDRGLRDGDSVVFFNFRPDRARELTRALNEPDFAGFEREAAPQVHYVCLTEYDATFTQPVAFPKEFPCNVLADVLAEAGLRQYHIAETEKYAHVTFFLNGGVEAPKAGETRKLIPSPKVATYDLQPEMSAPEVSRALAEAIDNEEADVYIVNFANCDMVGHTGVLDAAVSAVEAVGEGVSRVLDALKRAGGVALLTADHGNADKMIADDGGPHTAHTTAPVPLALIDFSRSRFALDQREGAALCDIAPTMLDMIGLDVPEEMTGASLLVRK